MWARAQERTSSGTDMATAGRASLGAARSTVPVGAKADADATKVRSSCRTDIKRFGASGWRARGLGRMGVRRRDAHVRERKHRKDSHEKNETRKPTDTVRQTDSTSRR